LSAADLCRKWHQRRDHKWRCKYGGMDVSDARKLKALEDENRKLIGPSRVSSATIDAMLRVQTRLAVR